MGKYTRVLMVAVHICSRVAAQVSDRMQQLQVLLRACVCFCSSLCLRVCLLARVSACLSLSPDTSICICGPAR